MVIIQVLRYLRQCYTFITLTTSTTTCLRKAGGRRSHVPIKDLGFLEIAVLNDRLASCDWAIRWIGRPVMWITFKNDKCRVRHGQFPARFYLPQQETDK